MVDKLLPKKGSLPEADEQPDEVERGQWYWRNNELWCCTQIGSNYVQLQNTINWSCRIHFDEFWDVCRFEPNASDHIRQQVSWTKDRIQQLLQQINGLTASLAIGPTPLITAGQHTSNTQLVLSGSGEDPKAYEARLIKAKQEELPELFKAVKAANEDLARWLGAEAIPLKSQVTSYQDTVKTIDDRILAVSLYAGLVEELQQVKAGEPAPMTEKIRLMQRRHYMDEECLVNYSTGGMRFPQIQDFDAWLSRPENFERILPFPRTIVAFRVRRNSVGVNGEARLTLMEWISVLDREKWDKTTFLYCRNGEQLFRLQTAVEFEEKLFPDLQATSLDGTPLWAKVRSYGTVEEVIPERQYLELLKKDEEAEARYQALLISDPEDAWHHKPWSSTATDYAPFNRSSVAYDDIRAKLQDEQQQHNRIVMILQGLLDRSIALHPHPPWQLWSEEGFNQALELIYDDSRALTTGHAPDFEAYRKRLNKTLRKGCLTVGQEDYWLRQEAKKLSDRDQRYAYKNRYRPDGDPGPGEVANVDRYRPKTGVCEFRWLRERRTWRPGPDDAVRAYLAVPPDKLLNVSAYTPGDFKQFFADPRTRAQYIQWAPLLLTCEEYLAGNIQAGTSSERG